MKLDKLRSAKSDAAAFMEKEITHIIKTFGKRDPGSEGEKQAVDYMAKACRGCGCEDVKTEPFELHPAAFMGWIYITATFILAACLLTIIASVIYMPQAAKIVMYVLSMALVVTGSVIMIAEFVLYRQMVDKIYPKKISYNLTAVKKPRGEVRHRVFLNGHPDAAYEWTFNYIGGGVMFIGHVLICFAGLLYLFAVTIAALCGVGGGDLRILAFVTLVFVPFWAGLYVLWNEHRIVDGANDNLTGCYMGIAVLKQLQEQGIELNHTEVGVLISGSEEAGLRGAKAWCKQHEGEYKDVDTIIISYDTIHEGKYLQVNDRDLNLTVPADKEGGDMFESAAAKVGVACRRGNVPLGATDSAAFNQGGFRAIGITAMNHNLQDYYHTRKDTIGNLDLKGLADCYEATVQFIEDTENK